MEDQLVAILGAVKNSLDGNASRHAVAVFDFDNSCIVNDVQEALLAYLCRHFLLRNDTLVRSVDFAHDVKKYHQEVFLEYYRLLEHGTVEDAYRFAVRSIVGFNEEEISRLTSETLFEEGNIATRTDLFGINIAKGLPARKNVIALANMLKAEGIDICVVTASSEIVVKTAMQHYGIVAECIGVKLEKDNAGIFRDSFIEPISVVAGKVDCIKHAYGADHPILGLGDSMNDFPMLEYSILKVVVDRNNALAREAEKRGWYILRE